MSIKIPYMRKKIPSTLLTLSAAIALLLSSPMLFFNILQPAHAQTAFSFRIPTPASGNLCMGDKANITFDAQGTLPSSNQQQLDITSGTFQITNSSSGQIMYSGSINGGNAVSRAGVWIIDISGNLNRVPNTPNDCAKQGDVIRISTSSSCSTAESSVINVVNAGSNFGNFRGAVECSTGGGNTTSSMSGTTTVQDSDGDGISDSSDKCPHNPYHRCFKEKDNTSTTTNEQQPSSTSSSSGNQTR